MFARFARRFEYNDPKLGKVTIPRGWAGELEDDVHQLASEAGALLVDKSATTTVVSNDESAGEKSEALLAAEKKVDDLRAKVAAATGDDKPPIVAELKIALAELKLQKNS
ncbi:hypothetical protein [Agrobacterium rosae]|uniref:hypothetical protein n=1 Tax=Agrobacterium rosae TaxID=1972867 RepID=UPI00122F591A|nr:hypothetical protein [Agrobacterium rosae]KAA3510107.1 hypothetical protein DXM21_19955 [Agrobacterium rosae]KAA3514948.1 hypothetical protein DXM25_20415 [Agrobacterium rosae]MQB50727.1 hypothetical protein [Agrobacterium rosae]